MGKYKKMDEDTKLFFSWGLSSSAKLKTKEENNATVKGKKLL